MRHKSYALLDNDDIRFLLWSLPEDVSVSLLEQRIFTAPGRMSYQRILRRNQALGEVHSFLRDDEDATSYGRYFVRDVGGKKHCQIDVIYRVHIPYRSFGHDRSKVTIRFVC